MLKYLLSFFLFSNAFALVDYSETTPKARSTKVERVRPTSSWYKGIKFGAGYEALKVGEADLNLVKFLGKYQTDFNLYFESSFWAGKGAGEVFGPGNLETKVGYSWPTSGSVYNQANLDISAGVNFSTWESNFASERIDQIYSIFSTKRFYKIFLGLGADWKITGDSKNPEVLSIGNISTYFAMAGWDISRDIKLVLEGGLVVVGAGKTNENSLDEKMKYTYISPLLQLGIFSQLWVELGAAFKINDEGYNDSLVNARLYDLKGIYGNSLFTGIKYSL